MEYLNQRSGVFKKKDQSSLIIALIGSKSGVGTTHLGFGLSVYLNQKGYPNLYEEHNSSGAAKAMANYLGAMPDTYGIFRAAGLNIKPDYGPAVRLGEPGYEIVIRDYGTESPSFETAGGGRSSASDQGRKMVGHQEMAGRSGETSCPSWSEGDLQSGSPSDPARTRTGAKWQKMFSDALFFQSIFSWKRCHGLYEGYLE